MKSNTEKRAEKWLNDLYAQLVDLAGSCEGTPVERRKKALEAIEDVKLTLRMLSSVKPPAAIGDFTLYRDPSAVVRAYLESRGKPATKDEIIDGVFEGGYRGGDKDNFRYTVDQAIRNRLSGTGNKNPKFGLKSNLKMPDGKYDIRGLIGLKDWDDSLFLLYRGSTSD